MRLYVDTNVYLDFLLERSVHAEPAWRLFAATAACKHQIILSDAVLRELQRYVTPRDTRVLFALLERKFERVDVTDLDAATAKAISTHAADALHVALARRSRADCIVTRNVRDFRHVFKTKMPENIL